MHDKGNLKLNIHEKTPESEVKVEMNEYYEMKEKIYSLQEEKN